MKNKFRTHFGYNHLDLGLFTQILFLNFGLFINACSKKPFSKTSSHLETRPLDLYCKSVALFLHDTNFLISTKQI